MDPITITTVLGAFVLQGVAPGLGKALGEAAGGLFVSRFRGGVSGLPQKVQEDSRYQEAMAAYFRKDIQLGEKQQQLGEQQLQAQQEFNQQLLKLLGEWQANTNQNKLTEIQNDWDKDNWFSKLDRRETEQILGKAKHRLLILASNPDISQDCPLSFHNNLRTEIRNGTETFLREYYLSKTAPVEFYGNYFKVPISKLDVIQLYPILGTVPTVILYSEITDYQVNFHIGFWGIQNDSIAHFPIPVWNWEKAYSAMTKDGQTEEKQAYRQIRQAIVQVHQLLAGFTTDWYYLHINPFYEPQLFHLDSEFSAEWIKPFIEQLQEPYRLNQSGICYERGLQLANLKRYPEAVANFDKALQFQPGFEEAEQQRQLILSEAAKMDPKLIPPWKRREVENP